MCLIFLFGDNGVFAVTKVVLVFLEDMLLMIGTCDNDAFVT